MDGNKELTKSKIIIGLASVFIIIGIIFLGTSLYNLSEAMKVDIFISDEPIKVGFGDTTLREEDNNDVFSIVTYDIGSNYNPVFASTEGETIVSQLVFEPLFQRDATGQYKRILADNIQYSEDRRSIVVYIKDDILFSDGTPLTIEDVEISIKLHALNNGAGTDNITGVNSFRSNTGNGLEGLNILSDTSIEIAFNKYSMDNDKILETLIQKVAYVYWDEVDMNERALELLGDGVGTHSYMINNKSNNEVLLIENPHYREENKGIKLVRVFNEYAVDIDELIDEKALDLAVFHRDSGYFKDAYNNDWLDIYSEESTETLTIFINRDYETMNNPNIKQALYYAINQDDLVADVVTTNEVMTLSENGEDEELTTRDTITKSSITNFKPVSSLLADYGYTANFQFTGSDVEKAKEYLELAKKDLGLNEISIYIPIVKENAIQIDLVEKISNQLTEVGFKVTIDEVSISDYMDYIYISNRFSIYIGEYNSLLKTEDFDDIRINYLLNKDFPIETQLEFIGMAMTDEEKFSAYEALEKSLIQESSMIPIARSQNFMAISNYWNDLYITPFKKAPHNLHLATKKESN